MFFKKKYIKISRNYTKNLNNLNSFIICKNYIKTYNSNKFLILFKNSKKNLLELIKVNIFINILFKININLYKKLLLIEGVGYKFILKKNYIYIFIGYSHPVIKLIPIDIIIEIKDKVLYIYSYNSQRLGEFCNYIKNIKKFNSYKLKGIRFIDEKINLKNVKKK